MCKSWVIRSYGWRAIRAEEKASRPAAGAVLAQAPQESMDAREKQAATKVTRASGPDANPRKKARNSLVFLLFCAR